MTLTAHEVDELKAAPAVDGILPAVHRRWSAQAYSDRAVDEGILRKLFEAARWAPSSNNEQPWRFLVGLRGTATHDALMKSLKGFNLAWAPKAPVLILGVALKNFSSNGKPNGYALYDLGAATVLIALQAAEMGLNTHQMGGFEKKTARELLDVPEEYELGSLMALGYQTDPDELGSEQLIAQEVAPRTRKPLNELVFSAWGEPATFVK
ncbi:MAG: nitroreductase family protein [Acidobacteriota bacterium]|nr:nitroreductase family protein [Acidobacteriota bacterium]